MTPGRIDRRLVVLTFTAAISTLTIACTSLDGASGRPEGSMMTSDAVSTEPTDPLEGNWFHDKVPCSVRRETVIAAGFSEAEWIAAFPDGCAGEVGPFELRFLDGRVIGIGDDGTIGWDSSYEFKDGDTVVLDDGFDHSTIDFTIEGDTMTMHLVKLTAPTSKGELTYERVYLVAAWIAGAFTRMS